MHNIKLLFALCSSLLLTACPQAVKPTSYQAGGPIESLAGINVSFDAKLTSEADRQIIRRHTLDGKVRKLMNQRLIRIGRYNPDSPTKLWVSLTGYRLEEELKMSEVDNLSANLLFVRNGKTIREIKDVTMYVRMKDVYANKITNVDNGVHVDIVTYSGLNERVDDLARKFSNKIIEIVEGVVPKSDQFGGVKGGFGRSRN